MKYLKITGLSLIGYLMSIEPAWASCHIHPDPIPDSFKGIVEILPTVHDCPPGFVIPEIDGSGAILALGLVAGLVALIREKYFRK